MNLLPCPFCGSSNVDYDLCDFDLNVTCCIRCEMCEAQGPEVQKLYLAWAKAEAGRRWNGRAETSVEVTQV